MINKMEEDDNDKRKEIGIIKGQLQKVCAMTYISFHKLYKAYFTLTYNYKVFLLRI